MDLNRKRTSKEQKINTLSELFENGTPISELATVHGIHPIIIDQWKRPVNERPKQDLNIEKTLRKLNDLK
jgi:transposase-like protein